MLKINDGMLRTQLNLYQLCLPVFLGVPEIERSTLQSVYLDLQIRFLEPPLACQTDSIEDTICYATLTSWLEETVLERQFKLIEHLAYTLYLAIQSKLSPVIEIALRLKKNPPLPSLEVSEFCIGHWI